MKIGIYDPYLDTLSGGERYMLTAASCLSSLHEVEVFWDDSEILARAHEKFQLNLSKVKVVKNIFSSNTSIVTRFLQSRKYDRIIFLSDGSIPLTLAKKTLLHFQFPVEWVDAKSIFNSLKIKKISQVICNSNYTKSYIDKKFNVNSSVLYPPCGEKVNRVYDKEKKNIILSVGRFDLLPDGTTFKKHEFLIETFKEMVKDGLRNWDFIIVLSYLPGMALRVKELEEAVGGSGIKIIKNADFSEIKNLYSKAKIYWHAAGYKIDVAKRPELAEHFGITTVEAMSHGVVPVVINSGGQKEIVDDGENGYLWNDKHELMQKTNRVIAHDRKRQKMAEMAIRKSEVFSTDVFCKELSSLLI